MYINVQKCTFSYIYVHLCDANLKKITFFSVVVVGIWVKCTSGVHFQYILSTFKLRCTFLRARLLSLVHLKEPNIEMYRKVGGNEHENKCTEMYKNVFTCRLHLHTFAARVRFSNVFFSTRSKCTRDVLEMYSRCTSHFPGFPRNSGSPNVLNPGSRIRNLKIALFQRLY